MNVTVFQTIYRKCESYEKGQCAQIEALLYNPLFTPTTKSSNSTNGVMNQVYISPTLAANTLSLSLPYVNIVGFCNYL